jgi:hypothetical protein
MEDKTQLSIIEVLSDASMIWVSSIVGDILVR